MSPDTPANERLFEVPWDEEYAAAPGRPQPPQITPRNQAEVRAVGKALKSTGLQCVAGPLTAGTVAGVMLSELRRLGFDVVPYNAEAIAVRIRDAMTRQLISTFVVNLSTPAGWAQVLDMPATNNAAQTRRYVIEIGPVA